MVFVHLVVDVFIAPNGYNEEFDSPKHKGSKDFF